jgi:hypothetical protein
MPEGDSGAFRIPPQDDVENVLLVHGKDLARFIFEQMKTHFWETPADYRATVSRGFRSCARRRSMFPMIEPSGHSASPSCRRLRQIIEIALAYILVQLLDTAAVLVDFIDVENVDDGGFFPEQVATTDTAPLITSIPGNQDWRYLGKFGDALKDILLGVWSEIADQLS